MKENKSIPFCYLLLIMFQYNQYESKKRKNDYGETSKSEKKVCIYLHPHNASKYHARKNKFGHIQRVVTELVINIAFRLTVNFYLTFCHLFFSCRKAAIKQEQMEHVSFAEREQLRIVSNAKLQTISETSKLSAAFLLCK